MVDMREPDGGPAFPMPCDNPALGDPVDGMSLREHYAGIALGGLLTSPAALQYQLLGDASVDNADVLRRAMVAESFNFAEAMIAEARELYRQDVSGSPTPKAMSVEDMRACYRFMDLIRSGTIVPTVDVAPDATADGDPAVAVTVQFQVRDQREGLDEWSSVSSFTMLIYPADAIAVKDVIDKVLGTPEGP